MAHTTPSTTSSPSPPSPPNLRIQTRPRRLSKFTEGSELTRLELLQRTPTSNSLFFNILSEMDAHEAKRRSPTSPRKHRNSNSSIESFASSPDKEREFERSAKEGRRSITFGRKSLDERPRETAVEMGEKVRGIKGRIRALTVGKGGVVKPYPGT